MGRRTFLLIASIVVAAIGTGLVAIYVNNADARAQAGEQLVKVLIAKEAIPQGTSAGVLQGMVQEEQIPQRLVAVNAMSNLQPVAAQVTTSPILPKQQIVTQMFNKQAQAPANLVDIDSDKVAVMVQMSDPARLAGLLQPGSQIAIFVTSDSGNAPKTCVLEPKVTVVSQGGTVAATAGRRVTTPTALVTLQLDPREALRVVGASQSGALYFALLGSKADLNLSCLAQTDLP